jgi:hypothetical protein
MTVVDDFEQDDLRGRDDQGAIVAQLELVTALVTLNDDLAGHCRSPFRYRRPHGLESTIAS